MVRCCPHHPFLAVDANDVYWISNCDYDTVMKVGLSGGTPVTLAANQVSPNGIALDAVAVYWTLGGLHGSIMKLAK